MVESGTIEQKPTLQEWFGEEESLGAPDQYPEIVVPELIKQKWPDPKLADAWIHDLITSDEYFLEANTWIHLRMEKRIRDRREEVQRKLCRELVARA